MNSTNIKTSFLKFCKNLKYPLLVYSGALEKLINDITLSLKPHVRLPLRYRHCWGW
jgi:hypothetical protein